MAQKSEQVIINLDTAIKKRLKMLAVEHETTMTKIIINGVLKEIEQLEKSA